jgi:hypothetical protein
VKDALQQKTVGCLLIGGAALAVLSFGLMWIFSVAGVYRGTYTRTPVTNQITDAGTLNLVPVMLTLAVIGMLMFVGGLGYGFWVVKKEKEGPREMYQNFRVIARYAYDKAGHHLIDDGQIEFAERPRFYIRGLRPDGVASEYEASEEMWRQCGEGMLGEAEIQGKWLGRFTPYVGVPEPADDRLR